MSARGIAAAMRLSSSPGGGGSTANEIRGRGGVKVSPRRTVPVWRDHPTPSRISLRSCAPTLPLQGRVAACVGRVGANAEGLSASAPERVRQHLFQDLAL